MTASAAKQDVIAYAERHQYESKEKGDVPEQLNSGSFSPLPPPNPLTSSPDSLI